MEHTVDYHIFLIGFMGAGKSTVASALTRKLGMERMEMDQMIVEQQGMAITDIFEKYGEDHFREIESQMLLELKDQKPSIISCGGGVVVREQNAEYMRQSGHVVLLTAEPETILERVKNSKERPILNDHMNVEFISELLEKRRDKYFKAAEVIVATDGKSVEEICDEIIQKLQELKS